MKKEKLFENLYKYSEVVNGLNRIVYLLKGDKIILIDAGLMIDEKVDVVILTHEHFDHAEFARAYQKKDAKIVASKESSKHLADCDLVTFPMLAANPKGCKADQIVKENDIISNSNFKLKVIDSPGHTKGGIALYDKKKKILFSGDTWFGEDVVGIIALTGNGTEEAKSVKKLKSLKVNLLCPGH